MHYQFTAPRFTNFHKYAWYKSGYIAEHPGEFITPPEYCFESFGARNSCDKCYNLIFIQCAHCDAKLCMEYLLDGMHITCD